MNSYTYTNPIVRACAVVVDTLGRAVFSFIDVFSAKKKGQHLDPNTIKKIAIVRFDQIGDAFYMLPMVSYLKRAFPKASIDIYCTPATRSVFEIHPDIDRVFTFPYNRFSKGRTHTNPHADSSVKIGAVDTSSSHMSKRSFIKRIRAEKYDLYIDPRGEPFIALAGFLGQATYRIGIENEEVLSFLYTHTIRYNPQAPAWHRFRAMLDSIGVHTDGGELAWRPRMFVTPEDKDKADKVYASDIKAPFVALHISAGYTFKMWPLERFSELMQKMGPGYRYAIFGTQADKVYAKEIVDRLAEHAEHITVVDLTGKLSIRETYALLGKATLFVGNDSALAHFAAGQDIPTVEIMNIEVKPSSCVALGSSVAPLIAANPKHVCLHANCPYPCEHMKMVSVDDVYKACQQYL